ncbi:hypothetical protein SAMN02745121_01742 [Nannocystis exedens]|uniref:Uncharacterized protein n=1 Tax=Nannocystis exedens TaxID=54 RepID=A0A1I1VLH0_9BACT|nr:hypothetical protein [Nannocystis exedens]PCC72628.1 hypothetical protein NAEX_05711 [Nannocystis exedens]SFD83635.1 hypothetical protein SAMN02745121_01742 [Nannocystis exedens]
MTEHHHDSTSRPSGADGHGAHGGHGHGGGHELDAPPTRELFNIVWGLGALTLLSLVTCVQLFNDQARDLNAERGKEGSALLAKYRKDMEGRTRGAGEDVLTDATGKVVARYNYIPLASARDLILAKPEKLGAFAPPPGWIHPDDVAAGGQKAGTPPSLPPAAPEGTPAGGAPVDGAAPAGAPAEGTAPAPTDGTAPAGAAAAGTAPAGTSPSGGTTMPTVNKDDAMPLDLDKGQRESAKQVPGGTVEPVGSKSHPGAESAAPAPAPNPAPEPAKAH